MGTSIRPFQHHLTVGVVLALTIACSFVNVLISESILYDHSRRDSLAVEPPLNNAELWRRRIIQDAIDLSEHRSKEESLVQTSASNKTLVIVIGNLRGGEPAWRSLYQNVLDVNSADLALVIGKVPLSNQTSSMYHRAKFLHEFPEYEDYADAIDLIHGSSWRQAVLPLNQDPYGLFGGALGRTGSGAVIFMARWFTSQFLKQQNLLRTYDRFVITRSDHYYACPYDMTMLDPKYIHVPIGEDWRGITDRHSIIPQEHVLATLNMFTPLMYNTSRLLQGETLRHMNPERFIKARWQEEGVWKLVRRHDRVMFTCAVDGDKTRWQHHSRRLQPEYNVYVKYYNEFLAATCTCGGQHWNETEKICVSAQV